MKLTIKELAKMASVSATTVSLVLNDKPSRISQAKKEEIKALAKKHQYVPNFTARNLVLKKSKTIGLLIPDIENLFFSAFAKKVEDEFRKSGYSLILVNSNDHYQNDIELIKNLVNRGVDGLLLTISNDSFKFKPLYDDVLSNIKIPYVFVDRTFGDEQSYEVYFNDQLGGYLATKYLISKNHQRIACLSANQMSLNGKHRYKGYLKALNEAGIKFDENLVFEGDYKFLSGYNVGDKIYNSNADGLFACNDLMAYGAIKRLKELGKNIPNDIEVVGYDNLEFASMLGLNMPSVEQNIQALGSESVKLLMSILKGKTVEKKVILEPILKLNNH